ncbi:hypothetical protein WR25_17391 [Diploscapter pachys]|uniref:Uncharacterized protein n=1 Tax=Diploscapter pachys TaxID=2018661 RepID=A0A2A2JE81_9BILA|nr:hypothetical protein WR25_17391 [Diploscapter pachys]
MAVMPALSRKCCAKSDTPFSVNTREQKIYFSFSTLKNNLLENLGDVLLFENLQGSLRFSLLVLQIAVQQNDARVFDAATHLRDDSFDDGRILDSSTGNFFDSEGNSSVSLHSSPIAYLQYLLMSISFTPALLT